MPRFCSSTPRESVAIAERMRFDVWCAFISIWFLVVYCPIAHMVWSSEGWLFKSSAIDFAGGLVVHMSSGFSALVAALMLGKRVGLGNRPCAANGRCGTTRRARHQQRCKDENGNGCRLKARHT